MQSAMKPLHNDTRRFSPASLKSDAEFWLDLLLGEGRATEMAEHLRKERIGF